MKWEMVKLGELVNILSGFAFDSNAFSDETGFPVIRIRDVKRGYTKTFYNSKYDPSFIISKGDMLIGMDGEFNIGVWKSDPALLNQRVCKIESSNQKRLDNGYLLHFLPFELKKIEDRASFVTVKHLSVKDIREISIPLPPLATQKRIAEILDKADALRQKDQALLRKYDELAQAVFVDMFGDPVRNEKGWEVSTIGDVCFSVKDGPHVSPKYTENGIPFISVNNIIGGEIDLSNSRYISHSDFEIYSVKSKPEFDDILYTKGGTTGFAKRVDVNFDLMNWVHIAVLKFNKNKVNSVFFEYMLNNDYCYNQSQKYTRGIANRDLVLGEMKKISILLPPINLQLKFQDQILLIERQKKVLKKLGIHSESLFQSLLQKAFTGELVP